MTLASVLRCLLWALLLCAGHVSAVIETYEFSDPVLEQRYHALSQELRCPKCQNQNIADSNAPISRDLRVLLHDQLEAGANDEEILGFMVARYGNFVRYRPAVDENTAVLWYGPGVLAVLGLIALGVHLTGRKKATETAPTSEELAALQAKLSDDRLNSHSDTDR